jgi:DNA-directed RNA polymerase specialized sigma54-like protein
MALSDEEKGMVEEALSVYLQLISRQLPQAQVQQAAAIAQGIINKLDNLGFGADDGKGGNKPSGISDEWYEAVCKQCDMMGPGGCEDKVTLKYPGKCDPILHYEREKFLAAKANG